MHVGALVGISIIVVVLVCFVRIIITSFCVDVDVLNVCMLYIVVCWILQVKNFKYKQ